jgi:hypothetical protein
MSFPPLLCRYAFAPARAWISANRRSAVTVLAAGGLVTALLAITTAGAGDAPITPRLVQQAAAEAQSGGYDYTCRLYGAPRQIVCQGQGASVSFLVSASGQPQPEPGIGQ